ncbi:MAG: hypothetical protein IKQ31_05490 [Clostridia bacterium]|nr:hypothetical protein [Clostridia bacterium]
MIFSKDMFFTTKFIDSDPIYVKLEKAGYIKQISSGIYAYLELFNKLLSNICNEIGNIFKEYNISEVKMPLLQDANLWKNSGRFDIYGKGLFVTGENAEYVLSATSEEAIIKLIDLLGIEEKQLPFCVYQISERLRNELRTAYGLFRTKTFTLADCYAIVNNTNDLAHYTHIFKEIFHKIGVKFNLALHEAIHLGHNQTISIWCNSKLNQSHPIVCKNCNNSFRNKSLITKCPICNSANVARAVGAEIGDIATIQQLISTKKINNTHIVTMGIGLTRLIQLIAEQKVYKNGFDWDYWYAPYKAYIVASNERRNEAQKIYDILNSKIDALFDNRAKSIATKLIDADLIGCPYKIILGNNTCIDTVEIKRSNKMLKLKSEQVLKYILDNR